MIKRSLRHGQEEMVGFAVIIGIVAVIRMVFLWFAISDKDNDKLDDYRAESFLRASMQYTTGCEGVRDLYSLSDLAFVCYGGDACLEGNSSCDVLTTTLSKILEESWQIGKNSSIKGYEFTIFVGKEEIYSSKEGDVTSNSRGAREILPKPGINAEFIFKIYS